MIYKSSTSYLEHCRRRYPYRGRLPAVFNISITGFFLWKTRLKIEIKKQNCNFNMSLICYYLRANLNVTLLLPYTA